MTMGNLVLRTLMIVLGSALFLCNAVWAGTPADFYVKACNKKSDDLEKQIDGCVKVVSAYSSTNKQEEKERKKAVKKLFAVADIACSENPFNCFLIATWVSYSRLEEKDAVTLRYREKGGAKMAKLCKEKNAQACVMRGLMWENGWWSSETDFKKAASNYRQACKNGNPNVREYLNIGIANLDACAHVQRMEKGAAIAKEQKQYEKDLKQFKKLQTRLKKQMKKNKSNCFQRCAKEVADCAAVAAQDPNHISAAAGVSCWEPGNEGVWSRYYGSDWTLETCTEQCELCEGADSISNFDLGQCQICPKDSSIRYDEKRKRCVPAFTSQEAYKDCIYAAEYTVRECKFDAHEKAISDKLERRAVADCQSMFGSQKRKCAELKMNFTDVMNAAGKSSGMGKVIASTELGWEWRTATDVQGRTLLHIAAKSGNLEMVTYLVEQHHVPVWLLDKANRSAVDYASEQNHDEVVKYLKAHGAKSGSEYQDIIPR